MIKESREMSEYEALKARAMAAIDCAASPQKILRKLGGRKRVAEKMRRHKKQ